MLADWKGKRFQHFATCCFFSTKRVIGGGGAMFTFDALAHMFDVT